MRGKKTVLLLLLLAVAGWTLAGCTVLSLKGDPVAAVPNLGLLQMEPYQAEPSASAGAGTGHSYLRVDLWLDASQVMGGINPDPDSIYPHTGRKYREGGFHYRLKNATGWYENVLRNLLGAADGSQVRVLRFGNERIPDSALVSQGLAGKDDGAERLSSLRRDLLTYAVNPLPSLFAGMSAEDMAGSYYALGSPQLNQMAQFAADGGAELENPGQVSGMSNLLDKEVAAFAAGSPGQFGVPKTRSDSDFPLIYALQNIDLSRLSVITFDPAGLRRMAGTDNDGKPVQYIEELLRSRGVFEKGLCAGLYAFRLDYCGQMATIGPANLTEPLIWGKPIYNEKKREIKYIAGMPRILMGLVVGVPDQVDGYMAEFSGKLDRDPVLGGLRGPQEGELTYARAGQTVTQQPFGFAYWQTVIGRPSAGLYSQHTDGVALSLAEGLGTVERVHGLQTALLSPGENGKQGNRTLTLRFPLGQEDSGATMDLSKLQGAGVEVVSALLLTQTLPNTRENQREAGQGEQIVPLRDRLYVYTRKEGPLTGPDMPFLLKSIGPSQDGRELVAEIAVAGDSLKEGYYRLRLSADLTDEEVDWLPVDWIDGGQAIGVAISNEDIVRWESFTAFLAEKERGKGGVPRSLQHAWGSYTTKPYNGVQIPECPPVERAFGLAELASQLREAATAEKSAFVRYVVDVFVDNGSLMPTAVAGE